MTRERILVIGLDGATLDLIYPWAAEGHLPNLARLIRNGASGPLRSTFPPVSPAAWTSFMTGKSPGRHGVFDFTVRDFRSYDMRVAARSSEPTIWRMLSTQGRQVCVVNVPQTYPPEEVNGYMVTGLGTPSGCAFTYPDDLSDVLRKKNYQIVTHANLRQDGPEAFVQGVYRVAEQVTDTMLDLMNQVDWDLGMVVLRLTDEIPHYFWHSMDETHPAHTASDPVHKNTVRKCYQKADELLGRLIERADDRTTILVVSDHGFGPLHKDVCLNEWLRRQGLLTMRSHPNPRATVSEALRRLGLTQTQVGHALARLGWNGLRSALRDVLGPWAKVFPQDSRCRVAEAVDWKRTQAYSVGYIGQIYVNLAGREPRGTVSPGREYERLRDNIVERLLEMTDPDDGRRVVSQVFKKEDIYEGPFLTKAPDLLVEMRNLSYITRQSYQISERRRVFSTPPTQETGSHRMDGVLIACGNHIREGFRIRDARIEDLAPTILHLHNYEVPVDMDGEVLVDLFDPEFIKRHPVKH
ncbi:MAG: alkaline phosphatase family protein, partial [bacterium]